MASRLDRYELRRAVGRGAAGTVYEAWDTVLNRRVAIKVVQLSGQDELQIEEVLLRFRQEAQVASRLSHPGVVSVHNYGEAEGVAFIDMEFIEGETLKTVLSRGERLPLERTVGIIREVLLALDYCHRKGIVHRDIKPANIMLPEDGGVKLADFGIARIANSELTLVGTMIGTPLYMSPEQFAADQSIDSQTDIWSTGVVLYEMLTGEQPFSGESLSMIRREVVSKVVPPPSSRVADLPPGLDEVLELALKKSPRDRFKSADAFAEALRLALLQPIDPTFTQPGPHAAGTLSQPVRRRPGGITIALTAGGALTIAGVSTWLWLGMPGWPLTDQTKTITGSNSTRTTSVGRDGGSIAKKQGTRTPGSGAEKLSPRIDLAMKQPDDSRIVPAALEAQLADLPCSTVTAAMTSGIPVFRGVIGSGKPRAALDSIAAALPVAPVQFAVQTFPHNQEACAMAEMARANAGGARLSIFDARAHLVLRDEVRLRLRMPDFDGDVRLEDLNVQGNIVHLMDAILGASPRHRAGEDLGLGRDGSDLIGRVDPPFGTELVVAIVSSEPLFTGPRPAEEKPADFMIQLQSAVALLKGRGGRVAMDALSVTTSER